LGLLAVFMLRIVLSQGVNFNQIFLRKKWNWLVACQQWYIGLCIYSANLITSLPILLAVLVCLCSLLCVFLVLHSLQSIWILTWHDRRLGHLPLELAACIPAA
jgi:hypothetical protein